MAFFYRVDNSPLEVTAYSASLVDEVGPFTVMQMAGGGFKYVRMLRQAIRGSHLHMARVLRDAGAPVEEAARLVREHEGLDDFGALFAN